MGNFTTVPDKADGDDFTELMWDVYLKDNLNKGINRPIADVILGGSAASIDLTSIDQNFAHLRAVVYGRTDQAAVNSVLRVRMNNDSAANYFDARLLASDTSASETGDVAAATSSQCGFLPGATAAANHFGVAVIDIPYYTGAANFKALCASGYAFWAAGSGNLAALLAGGSWVSAAAINRLTFFPGTGNLVAGSRITLYGLAF